MATAFETEDCSRCGGTGKFSHNGEHDRCYKCDGKNGARAYTKRGAAAKAFYDALRVIKPADVKVGDVIAGAGMKQLTVATIEERPSIFTFKGETERRIDLVFKNTKGLTLVIGKNDNAEPGSPWALRRLVTKEENAEFIRQALEYQATLTKQGTPRKRG